MPQFDVSVIGELNLDLIFYGLPEQLVLEREHLAKDLSITLGSSSAIFAHNLALLGNRVGDFLVAKPEIDVPDRRAAVEILLATGVPYVNALAASDDQWALGRMFGGRRETRQFVLAIELLELSGVDFEAQRAPRTRRFLCRSH